MTLFQYIICFIYKFQIPTLPRKADFNFISMINNHAVISNFLKFYLILIVENDVNSEWTQEETKKFYFQFIFIIF